MSFVDCCRLCLKNLTDILLDDEGYYTIHRDLQRMIYECFQIMVSDGEIISKVCSQCNDQIRFFDKTRKRVRGVDFEIKQYYASIVKQQGELLEELSNQSQTHTNEDTELHQTYYQELEVSAGLEDTICSDNSINRYDFIKIEPQVVDLSETYSAESQCEREHSYNIERKKRHKKTLKKFGRKVNRDLADSSESQSYRKHSNHVQKIKCQQTTSKKFGRKVDSNCYICKTDLDTAEALDSHLSSHVGITEQVCNICQIPVPTIRYLNMHLRRLHFRKGDRIPCEECKQSNIVREFSSNYTLQAHIKMVHEGIIETPERNHVCTYCGKSFVRASALRLHENTHTKEILFKCKQCPFTGTSRSGLTRHLRIHTAEKPFKCDECDASFNQSTTLHTHKAGRHGKDEPFSCEICGDRKRFKTKYTFQNHMRAHRTGESTDTEKKVKNQQKVTAMGTKIVVVERELKCNFCPAVYSWENFLCRHIVEKHPDENVPMLHCELCQESNKKAFFLTQSAKNRHIDKHNRLSKIPTKERVCSDCGDVFHTSDSFHRHRQTHIEHVCKDCGKSFATRRTLRLHVVTVHLKSRPYKCDKCDAAFGQLTSLTAHMKVHQRPHKPPNA